ncbi:MAG TPA: hypothetical protein ENI67_04645 [Gammaproteobacteria bacterium]|nr:hypothetical protein [Gammaproteobacteria bacterium]
MNQKQKAVLIITAVFVGIMMFFPPYVVLNYSQVVIKSGYGFLMDLPPYISENGTVVIPATMNVATLFIQIFAALVVGVLAYLALRK